MVVTMNLLNTSSHKVTKEGKRKRGRRYGVDLSSPPSLPTPPLSQNPLTKHGEERRRHSTQLKVVVAMNNMLVSVVDSTDTYT